jgi:hypothetical protein
MYEKINLHPRFNQTLQERKATIIMNDTSINLVKFTGQHIMQMKNKKYTTNETRCVRNFPTNAISEKDFGHSNNLNFTSSSPPKQTNTCQIVEQ